MEKETIEANDLKFRKKLQELRSNLASRQQVNQHRPKSRNFAIVAIPIVLAVGVLFYLTGKISQNNQTIPISGSGPLQIEKAEQPEVTNQKPDDETIHDNSPSEIESTNLSQIQDIPSADLIDKSAKPDNAPAFSEEKPLEFVNASNNTAPEDTVSKKTSGNDSAGLTSLPEKSKLPPGTRITRVLTCKQVKSRRCASSQSVFALGRNKKVHVWMEVVSESVPYTLKHVYYHENKKYCEVPLRINLRRMRTWSNITLKSSKMVGSWRVEIVAEDGTKLGEKSFKVISRI